MTITAFVLSSVHWVMTTVASIIDIDVFLGHLGHVPRKTPPWTAIIPSFYLVNYIFTDGVVIWRAWVLCSDQNRVILMSPVIMLAINTAIYLFTVAACAWSVIYLEAGRKLKNASPPNHIINLTMFANLALSLLINIFATSIIAVKAWKYRKTLMTSGAGIRTPTRGIRILALVVESGMLYIFIGVMGLVSPFIHLPFGTVGQIVSSSSGKLAGMYPITILLLVETNRSLDVTYFSSSSIIDVRGGQPSQVEPMSFAAGPVHATSTQIEIESQTSRPRVNGHGGTSVEATSPPAILPVS